MTVTLLFLFTALFCMLCSMNAQGHVDNIGISKTLYIPTLAKLSDKGGPFSSEKPPFGGFIQRHLIITFLHVAAIMILNTQYYYLAEYLTEYENHRTQNDHENSLVWKRFLFEAVDCFGSLCFLAFFKCNLAALRKELLSLYAVDSL